MYFFREGFTWCENFLGREFWSIRLYKFLLKRDSHGVKTLKCISIGRDSPGVKTLKSISLEKDSPGVKTSLVESFDLTEISFLSGAIQLE